MTDRTSGLRYVVLGLLKQQPMSGYDIHCYLKQLRWLISSPGGGSLYPLLHRLLREDLVTVKVVPGIDRPPKKIYSITVAGNEALKTWIEEPISPNAPLKAFVLRLLLADSHSQAGLCARLQQRRVQVAGHQSALADGLDTPATGQNLGQELALDYGLALATAELAWLDTKLKLLRDRPPFDEDERRVRSTQRLRSTSAS
jgi:DNA-binding PadR family transcriptional regulator